MVNQKEIDNASKILDQLEVEIDTFISDYNKFSKINSN